MKTVYRRFYTESDHRVTADTPNARIPIGTQPPQAYIISILLGTILISCIFYLFKNNYINSKKILKDALMAQIMMINYLICI